MRTGNNVTPPTAETRGLVLGLLAVVAFSGTLPATRMAIPELGAAGMGLGRAIIAASVAAVLLLVRGGPLPARRHWAGLALVAGGAVIGFPLLTALAMRDVPASHAIVVVGLSPAATALAAVMRAGERPTPTFWLATVAGALAVALFAATQGATRPGIADLWLVLAVAVVGVAYAEGGRLARDLDGWRVICWALVLAAPAAALGVWIAGVPTLAAVSARAWLGLGYVSFVSALLGFFAWYRGMALGGIARVSQTQLLQPVLSVVWAALLLGEPLTPGALGAAGLVAACAAWARQASGARSTTPLRVPERVLDLPGPAAMSLPATVELR